MKQDIKKLALIIPVLYHICKLKTKMYKQLKFIIYNHRSDANCNFQNNKEQN